MFGKILWLIILMITIYLLLVFKTPNIAMHIEKTIWIEWMATDIVKIKDTYDNVVTEIPSKYELKKWALDFKEKFIEWVEITKSKIDSIRTTASWAEDTYNDLKEWYDKAKDFINTNSWKIDDIKKAINDVSNITNTINSNSWIINTITSNTGITNIVNTNTWITE